MPYHAARRRLKEGERVNPVDVICVVLVIVALIALVAWIISTAGGGALMT